MFLFLSRRTFESGEYLSDSVFVVLVAGEEIEVCDVADGLEAAGDQMGWQG